MSNVERRMSNVEETAEPGDFEIVDGEILNVSTGAEVRQFVDDEEITKIAAKKQNPKPAVQSPPSKNRYVFLPFVFLTVALLGGLRLTAETNNFLFLKPALVCLIFAAVLMLLFFRARLIELDGWISEDFSTVRNAANGAILTALFAASVQIFNSLLPERGLPFWIIGFCFLWTLWNNLFAEFDTKKLLKSLGAMFALAFVVKYLLLANLTAPASDNWLQGLLKNPTQEAFTWALDLPRFSAGTGYIQFFALMFYLIGLFLMPSKPPARKLLDGTPSS